MPPIALPIADEPRPERSDAAANRQRILDAARSLLEEGGFEALTMDAVATAAGVGKGTVFRRFGDRAGLTAALLDDYARELQDAILSGPPPLGPGAPPGERVEAFVVAVVRFQTTHMDTVMAAESAAGQPTTRVAGMLQVHLAALLSDIDPELDHQALAAMILAAISPPVIYRLRTLAGIAPDALERSALKLVAGVSSERLAGERS
jgi:AcrR family transcriptional regulator